MGLLERIKLAWNFVFNYKTRRENFDKIYKHNRVDMCYRCGHRKVNGFGELCDRCFDASHGY
jgi:rRNA maturation endonuclease Nob1